ncbi:hypothetical protein [Galactobacter sp.]|uniref:hypothetical protein n=1 Tax=Galactobacter sp. TaxID=2676125 RepID=UPI0025C248C7|nr:hypothetical protein [Galactobacter sp.]
MSKQHSTPSEQHQETERKVNVPKLVLAGLLLAIALIFIFSNLDKASLHFIGASLTMPGWVWFLLLLAVGVIIGSLFPWLRPRKQKGN